MPEMVSISVNGESRVPPGFRFHPTEEELLQYYLRKKVAFQKIDLDVIVEVDLNKLEPWDIQERCRIGSTPQNDWYFFSHKDKKYPTGTRTNRATIAGFWKATGRDKIIYGNGVRIGMRKTLVFYTGRAPHGLKSDWIMHEYRLDENGSNNATTSHPNIVFGDIGKEEGWVVCRIFKKKHFQKDPGDESNNSMSDLTESPSEGTLEQIIHNIGGDMSEDKSVYAMNNIIFSNNHNNQTTYQYGKNMMKLPSLKSPTTTSHICEGSYNPALNSETKSYDEQPLVGDGELSDWAVIDGMLAAHLSEQHHHTTDTNGHTLVGFSSLGGQDYEGDYHRHKLEMSMRSSSFSSSSSSGYNQMQPNSQNYYFNGPEVDLWSLVTRSSLPPSPSDNPCNAHT